jgi:hypothetical protein
LKARAVDAKLRRQTMPSENAIDLTVKHQFKELYAANLKSVFYRLKYILFGALVLLATNGYLLVYAGTHPSDDRWVALADNLKPLFFVVFIIVVLWIPILYLIHTRRVLRDPRTKSGYKYHVTIHGIRVEGSAGLSDLNWSAFVGAREESTAFWLYVSRTTFHLIPKRCFNSDAEIVEFRDIIRSNISKAKLRQ